MGVLKSLRIRPSYLETLGLHKKKGIKEGKRKETLKLNLKMILIHQMKNQALGWTNIKVLIRENALTVIKETIHRSIV